MGISLAMAAIEKRKQGKNAQTVAQNQQQAELVSYQDDTAMANRQATEEHANATDTAFSNAREVAKRTSTARVSAGEGGISGSSVEALLLDLSGQGLEAQTNTELNYARTTQSMSDQAQQRQNGYKTYQPTSEGLTAAGALSTGLQIGNVAYKGYQKSKGP